jgi:hypothetical protein
MRRRIRHSCFHEPAITSRMPSLIEG